MKLDKDLTELSVLDRHKKEFKILGSGSYSVGTVVKFCSVYEYFHNPEFGS